MLAVIDWPETLTLGSFASSPQKTIITYLTSKGQEKGNRKQGHILTEKQDIMLTVWYFWEEISYADLSSIT